MFPNFAALPPEVNAATLTTGPGPDSMRNVGQTWRYLSAQLEHARNAMVREMMKLSEAWLSPAATQMMTAAAAYRNWLRLVIDHAEKISAHARGCGRDFQCAVSEMVSLRTIADNRRQRAMLVNDNVLGIHTAAIEQLEAEYEQYWNRNARVMDRYAVAIRERFPLEPFAQPPQIINEQGLADVAKALLSQQQG